MTVDVGQSKRQNKDFLELVHPGEKIKIKFPQLLTPTFTAP